MHTHSLPGGLWPVMLTPFTENNQVDDKGLQALTEFYIQSGASGLFANCLSSEMFQLTDQERLDVVRTVVKTAGDAVPVIATGTFSHSVEKCSESIKRFYDTGVAAVVVVTNQLVERDEADEALKARLEQLMQQTGDIPLGLYECPDPYKRLLPAELMKDLGTTGRFYYHKDTSCNPIAIASKIEALRNSTLSFYNADTPTALLSLQAGASGLSPIGANFYPELYRALISGVRADPQHEEATELSVLLTVMDAVVNLHYPFSAKYFLQQRGLPLTTVCRVPYTQPTADDWLKIQALLQVFRRNAERMHITLSL